jgi:hypothetical protein
MEAMRVYGTATLAVTGTSASVALPTSAPQIEVQNAGASDCFIRWGNVALTAVVTDYPVLSGQSKVITVGTGTATLAAICAAGQATTLYVTSGDGF